MKKSLMTMLMASLFVSTAMADSTPNADATLVNSLKKLGFTVDSIAPTPIKDLFEVQADGGLFYVDKTGNYAMLGNLINLKTHESLTEKTMDQMKAKMVGKLFTPEVLKNAIKLVNGKGERQLIEFADPNCPYCRRLEKELSQLDNTTVYLFAVPLLGGRIQVEDFVCAQDPAKAWTSWMLDGKKPANQPQGCDKGVIQANLALVQQLGVRGVPHVYFKNGKDISGFTNKDEIEKNFE